MLPRGAKLIELESDLDRKLRQASFLHEVSFDDVELTRVAELLQACLQSCGAVGGTSFLESHAPGVVACFLVQVGAQGYREGDYWSAVEEALGVALPPNLQARWGRVFEDVCRRHAVAQVPKSCGQRYVTPILVHGGIPDYCLADYFNKLLLPVARGDSTFEEGVESISKAADKPIGRFFLHGGKVARDFFERCLDMAEAFLDGQLDPCDGFGLPERVVSHFKEWTERERPSRGRKRAHRSASGPRYRGPEVSLDLAQASLRLIIPQQSIPRGEAIGGRLAAFLDVDEDRRRFELRPVSINGTVETGPIEAPLRPFSTLNLTLQAGANCLYKWSIRGISDRRPWMAFNGKTGRLIEDDTLEDRDIWLLAPTGHGIESAEVLERSRVYGDYIAWRINLARSTELHLSVPEEGTNTVRIPIAPRAVERPFLEGFRFLSGVEHAFIGAAPDLCIPTSESDRDRWLDSKLTIEPLDAETTEPQTRRGLRVGDVCSGDSRPDCLRIHLSELALSGSISVGQLKVRLQGCRLGEDETFQIAFAPLDQALNGVTWAFAVDDQSVLRHESHLLEIDLEELEAASEPWLSLRIPTDPSPECFLELDGPTRKKSKLAVQRGRAQVRLKEFLDTIRAGGGVCRTLKLLMHPPNATTPREWELARVCRRWSCDVFKVETVVESNLRCLFFAWTDRVAVSNRLIRLWREERRLEEAPVQITVDEGAQEVCVDHSQGDLPGGRYLAEFTSREEAWAPVGRPDAFSEGVRELILGEATAELLESPGSRLDALLEARESGQLPEPILRDRAVADILAHPHAIQEALYKRGWYGGMSSLFLKESIGRSSENWSDVLPDIYRRVDWAESEVAAHFLDTIRKRFGELECDEGKISSVSPAADERLVVKYAGKKQQRLKGKSNKGSLKCPEYLDESTMYLPASAWHRIRPSKWANSSLCMFILAYFQRALVLGIANCKTETRNQMQALSRNVFYNDPDYYHGALIEADESLRTWAHMI